MATKVQVRRFEIDVPLGIERMDGTFKPSGTDRVMVEMGGSLFGVQSDRILNGYRVTFVKTGHQDHGCHLPALWKRKGVALEWARRASRACERAGGEPRKMGRWWHGRLPELLKSGAVYSELGRPEPKSRYTAVEAL